MNIELKDRNGITLKTAEKYCAEDVVITPKLQSKSVTENGNVVADDGYCGLKSVTVDVPATPTQEKTVNITENGTQDVTPDTGKVFSKVTVVTNVPVGTDTSDATAVAGGILSGQTAYARGEKLTGTIETYNGETEQLSWKATVSNLGAEDPATVVFDTPTDDVPKPWSEVEFNGDTFIKFNKIYRKVLTITDNQITSFSISNVKLDDDYVLYPCFIDEGGNELDYILVGKYMSKSSDTCNSVAAGSAVVQTIANGREKARARGTGYQLMDWRIQRLWQDLVICAMKTVDINSGSGIMTDVFGLYWGTATGSDQWIDGFCQDGTTWIYSNSPSKYISSPTVSSDGYSAISEYTPPKTGFGIQKLGYDATQPFFNYPNELTADSSYSTYYCDSFGRTSVSQALRALVGYPSAQYGAFHMNPFGWTSKCPVRLCYRSAKVWTYTITPNLANVTPASGNATAITTGETKVLTYTANISYDLPDTVTVAGATGVWNKAYGTLTLSNPTADITFTIAGVARTYTITPTLTNVTGASGNATSISSGETKMLTFTAEDGYTLPDIVVVAGATGSWDKSTGSLTLSNPTANVTFTIAGVLPSLLTPSISLVSGTTIQIDRIDDNATTIEVYADGTKIGEVAKQ